MNFWICFSFLPRTSAWISFRRYPGLHSRSPFFPSVSMSLNLNFIDSSMSSLWFPHPWISVKLIDLATPLNATRRKPLFKSTFSGLDTRLPSSCRSVPRRRGTLLMSRPVISSFSIWVVDDTGDKPAGIKESLSASV
ncbi:hypothetical protein K438DRAFT_486201 [Mycena galopus ATCC 62051]|nr:hypothetical protein K438DRAFT_486201 [Mycena galopus ATCC 62051]